MLLQRLLKHVMMLVVLGISASGLLTAASAPTVTTTAISGTTTTSANSGGNVTSDGGAAVTARGICWHTTTPTIANNTTSDGTGTGTFTSTMTGLTPGTLYYVRAYATNSVGTSYGATVSVRAYKAPTITTQPTNQSKIVGQTATFSVAANGTPNPTYQWRKNGTNISGATSTSYTTPTLTLGDNGALYSVVVTNAVEAVTSSDATLTVTIGPPVVTTTAISGITTTSANSGGNVTSDSGAAVTERGICWATTGNPTTANNTTSNGTGTGTFSSTLTGLTPGTTYYVRAYATNSEGTSYGNQVSVKAYETPSISTQPINQSKIVGQTATFTVTAIGTPNPTYQWRKDGVNISGATSATYNRTNVQLSDDGAVFTVVATNSVGSVTSDGATLSVTIGVPVLTTTAISGTTTTSANSGGNVTSASGAAVTARGVCWSTTTNPTTADSTTTNGTGTGSFTSALTGLTPGTLYYVRAYATNSEGTGYGAQVSFTAHQVPTITTQPVNQSKLVGQTATFTVVANGTPNPTYQWRKDGVNISGATSATYNKTNVQIGDDGAVFTVAVTNSAGTTTSDAATLTVTPNLPTLSTTVISGITTTNADSGGNVTADGGATITARGVCWSTTTSPTTANNLTTDGTGTGIFTSTMTDLTPGTTYYVRAYATNSAGTAYGTQLSFKAYQIPAITAQPANQSKIVGQTATFSVTANGTPNPTYQWRKNGVDISGATATSYTTPALVIGDDNALFSVAVTNAAGTTASSDATLTVTIGLPVLTTTAISGITTTSANSGGTITSDSGAAVTARGVCWATTGNPTTANNTTSDGTGTGAFTSALTGLTPGTTYYVRAYATNSEGTSYGNQVSVKAYQVPTISSQPANQSKIVGQTAAFSVTAVGTPNPTYQWRKDGVDISGATGSTYSKTNVQLADDGAVFSVVLTNSVGSVNSDGAILTVAVAAPVVTTTAISGVTTTSANSGGNVTSDSGAVVTARGVCWATTANPTTADSTTSNGTGTGTFTSALSSLTPGTMYYVRAYATNSVGTSYGSQVSFTAQKVPEITQQPLSQSRIVGQTAAFNVTANGVPTNLTYQWRKNGANISGATSSAYTTPTLALEDDGAVYSVMVTNAAGSVTSFDASLSVTVGAPPTVTTTAVSGILATVASSGGTITTDGGAPVTARGVCWSTTTNPTTANSKTMDGTGTGTFTSAITGLTPGTIYYVRAYATNFVGTSYGAEETFSCLMLGRVVAWGANGFGQTTVPGGISGVASISAGSIHTLALINNGTVVAWGSNADGQCSIPGNLTGVVSIASGSNFSVALKSDTTVVAWGDSTVPMGLSGVVAITAGDSHVLAIKNDATVVAWGENISGQATVPSGLNDVVAVAAGGSHSVALKGDGTVVMWGDNFFGQSTVPSGLNDVIAVAAGSAHTIALRDDGTVVTWGLNDHGQTTVPSGLSDVVAVAAGRSHTIALRGDGTVVAWGRNDAGQSTIPSGLSGVISISAGAYGEHTVALKQEIDGAPMVRTANMSGITTTGASSGGNVTTDNGVAVTARGVCWSTTSSPTTGNSKTVDGTGTGAFTSSITGLTPGTAYYARAYATNSVGTSYGAQTRFTAYQVPMITTQPASQSLNVDQVATFNVTASGVPTNLYQWRKNGVNITGAVTSSYTTPSLVIGDNGTVYSVVVTNAAGAVVSADATLTVTIGVPVVTTTTLISGITATDATSGGNVAFDSGAAVTARGICWATTTNPTIANSMTVDGTGTGAFVSSLTGLATSTTYYVRAYATNSVGTGYGPLLTFTTPAPIVRSLLLRPPLFDANAWLTNAAYRSAYLADNYPGRVWQTADGNVGAPALEIQGESQVAVALGGTVTLSVRGAPGSPITFALNGPGILVESGINVATIQADANGDAQVTYSASRGGGRIPILVGSPMSVGQVRFLVETP